MLITLLNGKPWMFPKLNGKETGKKMNYKPKSW